MFDKNGTITLSDDNEYAIVDQFNEMGTNYIYLVDINDNSNILYGKLENDEIVEITDVDELEKVIKLINAHLHNQ